MTVAPARLTWWRLEERERPEKPSPARLTSFPGGTPTVTFGSRFPKEDPLLPLPETVPGPPLLPGAAPEPVPTVLPPAGLLSAASPPGGMPTTTSSPVPPEPGDLPKVPPDVLPEVFPALLPELPPEVLP